MATCDTIHEFVKKLMLVLRKGYLIRKHKYIVTFLQIIIPVILALQIRLLFQPRALEFQELQRSTETEIMEQMPLDITCQYVPDDDDFINKLMSEATKLLPIEIKSAANVTTLYNDFTKGNKTNRKALWAIFNSSGDNKRSISNVLDYTIRSSEISETSLATWTDDDPSSKDPYITTGFIPLQLAIDTAYLKIKSTGGTSDSGETIYIARFPYFRLSLLIVPINLTPSVNVVYYMMVVAFLLTPVEVLQKAMHDKEKGFRDWMHLMGMTWNIIYAGWIIYMLIVAVPVTIICALILNPIFPNVNFVTVFAFILFYFIASTSFMLFLVTFFRNPTKACTAGTLLWLALGYLTILLDDYVYEQRTVTFRLLSLGLPHNGLLYGLFNFLQRVELLKDEGSSVAANITEGKQISDHFSLPNAGFGSKSVVDNWKSADSLASEKVQIPVILIFISWLGHFVLWWVLTTYFDNLGSSKDGPSKPWYYPCQKKIIAPPEVSLDYAGRSRWSNMERSTIGVTPAIMIRQLTKKFGNRRNQIVAVEDMNIDFYEGEFHVILGHNAAGKSCLLKLIVGIQKPTSGDIYIMGRDYEKQQDPRKNLISYCPQDDVLVNYLTAIEHVYLIGMLKGMSYKEAFEKARVMLTELGLESHKNANIRNFSPGMKRRLCLSMALIGNAKILVLDEPAHGVDPESRKKIWDLLLAIRDERTIIMTTNSMEAADVLSDRIAILASGKVECYGTKMHLNRRYGVAHVLSVVTEDDCNLDILTSVIQKYSVDEIKLRSKLGLVVKYDLPRKTAYTKLVQHLESNEDLLRIKSIGLNVTSIEEQFQRIGMLSAFKRRGGRSHFFTDQELEMRIRKRRHQLLDREKTWSRNSGKTLVKQQILLMFYKNALHWMASWHVYCYSLVFSIITVAVCLASSQWKHLNVPVSRQYEMNMSRYTASGGRLLLHDETESSSLLAMLIDVTKLYGTSRSKNYYVSKNLSSKLILTNPTWNSMKVREKYFAAIDLEKNNVVNLLYSVTASHSGPIALNLLHNALLRYKGCGDCFIRIRTEPISEPKEWQHHLIQREGIKNCRIFAIVVTLFLVLPSLNLITSEHRSSSKLIQLNTAGMSPTKYWLPIYVMDLLTYFLSILIVTSVMSIIGSVASSSYVSDLFEVIMILFFYGMAALPFGYVIHHCANNTEIAYVIVILVNIFVICLVNFSPTSSTFSGSHWKATYLGHVFMHLFPQYVLVCMIGTFLALSTYNHQCNDGHQCRTLRWQEDPCCQNCADQGCYRPLSLMWTGHRGDTFRHSLSVDILIFIIQALVFFYIVQLIETRWKRKIGKYFNDWIYPSEDIIAVTEPYVLLEKENVDDVLRGLSEDQSDKTLPSDVTMVVQNLSKKLYGRPVVRGVHFNLYTNECFGLLGMNGAGKSTVLKMLCGQELPTAGTAVIRNHELIKDKHSFLGLVGYCPQDGGVNKFMTARQILRMHAALRGIPFAHIADEVDRWLDIFDLLDYENMKIKDCPGGIRQKISILQSLIGDLPVLLLDEPTSGLDAIARQQVCDTLHVIRETGRSMVVASHSMEESEMLCLRIGILVNGQLVAIGSCEQLKHRHGLYYTLNVELPGGTNPKKIDQVKRSVEESFSGLEFKGVHAGILKYEIKKGETKYSVIFDMIEKLRNRHPEISDCSVNQTSMQHVFLSLCEKYKDVEIPVERPICLRKLLGKLTFS